MKIPFKQPRSLPGRILFWGALSAFVVLIAGFFILRSWLGSYLESEAFRLWLAKLTSKQLNARCEYAPFHFAGLSVHAEAFKAQGTEKAAFSTLEIEKIKTAVNLAGLWSKSLEIDDVTIDRFQISLGHTGAPPVPASEIGIEPEQQKVASSNPTWFSPKLDLRKVVVNELSVMWGEKTPQQGSVAKTEVTVKPDGEAWNIALKGGMISQHGEPDFKLDHAVVHYQAPIVDISDGLLVFPAGGNIGVTGQVNTERNIDVQVKVNGVPVKPFLPANLQSNLGGSVFADVKVSGPMPVKDSLAVSGQAHLENGELGGISILDFFANLLHTTRYSKVKLTTASASFVYTGAKLTVTNIVVESKGLICVKGKCVIDTSRSEGDFQVGIPRELMLPVLATQVFTGRNEGEGYVWLHIAGPLNDINGLIVRQIQKALPDAALNAAEELLKNTPKSDVPKKALEGLFKGLQK